MHERAAVTRGLAGLLSEVNRPVQRVIAEIAPDVDTAVVTETWSQAAAGSLAEGAELVCATVGHRIRCLVCEEDFTGGKLTPCPGCGALGLVVKAAPEFAVRTWEVT